MREKFAADNFPGIIVDFGSDIYSNLDESMFTKILPLLRRNFEKIAVTVMIVVLIQVFFLATGSRQKNKNEHTEYHGIFKSFKS